MTPYRRIGLAGLIAAVGYAAALAVAQVLVVSPVFAYQGFTAGRPQPWMVALSALSYLMSASQLPRELTRPSQTVYWMLFLFVVAPTHVTPLLLDLAGRPSPLPIVLSVSAAFTLLGLIYRIPAPQILTSGLQPRLFWTVVGVLTVGTLGLVIFGYGFRFRLPSFGEVYDVRLEYREATESVGVLSAYGVQWAGGVLGPLLFAAGLVYSRRWLLAAGLGCQFIIYSLTGFKSVTLIIVLICILVALSRRVVAAMVGVKLLWGALAGTVLMTIYDLSLRQADLSAMFTRRLMLAPGLLTYLYYDHFSRLPQLHLNYSILSAFSDNPYVRSAPEIIGRAYFGPQNRANANLWADGFANFGFTGVAVMTALLAVYLWVFDGIAQRRDRRLSSLLLVAPGFALVNAALLTSLLTHGLLLAMLLVLLMPASGERPAVGVPRQAMTVRRRRAPARTT